MYRGNQRGEGGGTVEVWWDLFSQI